MKFYSSFLKRVLDLLLATIAVVILSPLILVICIPLFFANKGKVFFLQERVGKNDKIFKIIKFKSMNDKTDAQGKLLPPKDRVTKVGKFIRATSIDELPQFINVLKGDMSIIGPRPLFVTYLPYYTERERIRHSVRPGITGLSQVSGRNFLTLEKRLELDVQYVEHLSFCNDIKILWKTVLNVLKRKDIIVFPDETKTIPLHILRGENNDISKM